MSTTPGSHLVPRPEILALKSWIEAIVASRRGEGGTAVAGSVLILAPRLQDIPPGIIRAPDLAPVDKLAWMVIFQSAADCGGVTTFPSYRTLTTTASLGSSATISRALATLRILRWMTASTRTAKEDRVGKMAVHTLHGQMLNLADTLVLDPGYLDYLRNARTHHHARVRALAETEWERCSVLPATYSAPSFLGESADVAGSRDVDALNGSVCHNDPDSVADSNLEPLQNSKRCRSSKQRLQQNPKEKQKKYNNNQNPVTNPATEYRACDDEVSDTLVFPAQLLPEQREVAQRYLARVPGDARQAVLDEVAGRLLRAANGSSPVHDPLSYLRGLCNRAHRGQFVPNLGLAVRNRRRQAPTTLVSTGDCAQLPKTPTPASQEAALHALAEIRAMLGSSFRASTATPPDSDQNSPDR